MIYSGIQDQSAHDLKQVLKHKLVNNQILKKKDIYG